MQGHNHSTTILLARMPHKVPIVSLGEAVTNKNGKSLGLALWLRPQNVSTKKKFLVFWPQFPLPIWDWVPNSSAFFPLNSLLNTKGSRQPTPHPPPPYGQVMCVFFLHRPGVRLTLVYDYT